MLLWSFYIFRIDYEDDFGKVNYMIIVDIGGFLFFC